MKSKTHRINCCTLLAAASAAVLLGNSVATAAAAAMPASGTMTEAHSGFDGLWRQYGRGRRPAGQPLGPCCSEQGWDDYARMLQPWAMAVMKQREAALLAGKPMATNTALCKPDGVPTVIEIPYPFRFLRTPTQTFILYEADYQWRRIRMNSSHPADLKPSWYGDSIGHWDGETLVIDTIGLNALGQLNWDGIPHTSALHVIERYTVKQPDELELQLTMTDAGALTGVWTITKNFRRQSEAKLLEYVCAENNRDMSVPTE